MLEGIDVSHHQATTPSLAGRAFLIARATYGLTRDDRYARHVLAASSAGLVTGAYHFGRHGQVAAQVEAFLDQAGDVDLYALDLESDGSEPAMTQAEARAFIAAVQAAGRPCGLYHSASGYPDLGQDWRWVADWRPIDRPAIAWDVWQYQGSPLDRDRFDGSAAELRSLGRSDMVTIDTTVLPFGGELVIPAGRTVTGIRVQAGVIVERKTWPAATAPSSARYDALVTISSIRGNPFARVVTGFFAGYLVADASVDLSPTPPPDCAAKVEVAVTAALEAAAGRAATAVRAR